MIYFIKRETSEVPFDGSISECQINKKVYDIVVSPSNIALERISDHVINDEQQNYIFEKTNPREEKLIREFIEERYGPMSEILLG